MVCEIEVCHETEGLHLHHVDYRKPLEVIRIRRRVCTIVAGDFRSRPAPGGSGREGLVPLPELIVEVVPRSDPYRPHFGGQPLREGTPQRNALIECRVGIGQRTGESTGLIGYVARHANSSQNPPSKPAHRGNPDREVRRPVQPRESLARGDREIG
jgi:hypothetical protein